METSVRDVRRFTPASYEGRDGAPVYLLSPPDWRARGRWRAALTKEGIRYPQHDEVARTARTMIETLAPANKAELLGIVEAFEATLTALPLGEKPGAKAPKDQRNAWTEEYARRIATAADFDKLVDALAFADSPIARLLALRVAWHQQAAPMAAAYGLVDWEGVPAPFKRQDGVVPDGTLEQIPESDLRAIGAEVIGMIVLSGQQRGF